MCMYLHAGIYIYMYIYYSLICISARERIMVYFDNGLY